MTNDDTKVDAIMEDLIVGHNFEYAGKAVGELVYAREVAAYNKGFQAAQLKPSNSRELEPLDAAKIGLTDSQAQQVLAWHITQITAAYDESFQAALDAVEGELPYLPEPKYTKTSEHHKIHNTALDEVAAAIAEQREKIK